MTVKNETIKKVFPLTIPVLIGYGVLGMAYGVLMKEAGYQIYVSVLLSLFLFAGSAQYLMISFLVLGIHPLYAIFMIFIVNLRHLFYGISMISKYHQFGYKKWYLVYTLTDETFSIVSDLNDQENQKFKSYFYVSILNHAYWVLSTLVGGLIGHFIQFNTEGLSFVLNALFIVIFLNQWQKNSDHRPALIGLIAALIALVFFGPDHFMIVAMLFIMIVLIGLKHYKKEAVI